MTLDHDEKLARLRLWRTPRVGPATFANLMQRFGSAQEALERLPGHVRALGRTPPHIPSREAAIREIETLHKMGGRFIFAGTPEASRLLDHTPDAPPLLATLGRVELLQRPTLAIVGSRNASLSGKTLTRSFAEAIGQAGYAIISGLAKGIDTAAHQAALPTGTIAVVAGGIDVIYPRENAALHQQIAEQGLIVSEQPLGMPTSARLFPLRNRLVSGLTLGTLVVEAGVRSGSLITARLAAEQGREVFAIPGSPLEGRAEGSNLLIKQGATLVSNAQEILTALQGLHDPGFEDRRRQDQLRVEPVAQDLSALRKRILDVLSIQGVGIDALTQECQGTPAQMQTALADLEVAGFIIRTPGALIALHP